LVLTPDLGCTIESSCCNAPMRNLKLRIAGAAAAAFLGSIASAACSAGAATKSSVNSIASGGSSSSAGGSSSSAGGSSSSVGGSDVTLNVNVDASTAGGDTGDSTKVECTDGGADCMCPPLTVAVIGKPGKWGAPGGDTDSAFQEWLNSNSAGTAKADVYSSKPTLTTEFLSPYSVVILASLADDSNAGPFWTFTDDEVAAFQDWVENKGGGVITLTGYSGDGTETKPTNQLTAFSGLSYNMDSVNPTCLDWSVCNCAGSQTLSDWNHTDPVIASVSNSVTWVGFANGRSINAPADAHVAATVQYNNSLANVTVGEITGAGRVLMYGDEWITYTSQWTGAGIAASNCTTGSYPQDKYQTAQFWFNMIKWVQPRATCFKIVGTQPEPPK